ncbi:SMI1/KNR4 family protein [Nocardia tengchongensis]|uniref:SMI1/KNR4 family protein n=1 Tax=Nocardia tengchongensis TaxID=2055889 RepID=UPI0036BA926C
MTYRHFGKAAMNPAIIKIISLMPPPLRPPAGQTPWVDIEYAMGVPLPEDYREFIDTYGDGRINQSLSVFFPARLSALRPSLAVLSDNTASLHALGFFDEFRGNPEFATAVGEPNALLLWGQTRRGDLLFWSTRDENPDHWTVTVFFHTTDRGDHWHHYDQGMAEFLSVIADRSIPESGELLGTTAGRPEWTRVRDWECNSHPPSPAFHS